MGGYGAFCRLQAKWAFLPTLLKILCRNRLQYKYFIVYQP
jgi:hypothetical protein